MIKIQAHCPSPPALMWPICAVGKRRDGRSVGGDEADQPLSRRRADERGIDSQPKKEHHQRHPFAESKKERQQISSALNRRRRKGNSRKSCTTKEYGYTPVTLVTLVVHTMKWYEIGSASKARSSKGRERRANGERRNGGNSPDDKDATTASRVEEGQLEYEAVERYRSPHGNKPASAIPMAVLATRKPASFLTIPCSVATIPQVTVRVGSHTLGLNLLRTRLAGTSKRQ